MKNANRRNAGFTLIELVVTIAILTLLAGILVPAVGNYMEKGKNGKVTAELRELVNAITNYNVDTGAWPGATDITTLTTTNWALTDIPCLYKNTFSKTGWNGPYLNKGVMVSGAMTVSVPGASGSAGTGLLDPWGNPYIVTVALAGLVIATVVLRRSAARWGLVGLAAGVVVALGYDLWQARRLDVALAQHQELQKASLLTT